MLTRPIAVVDTFDDGTAGTVDQYAGSEGLSINALQQRTRWWLEDASNSLNPEWLL